ncbi:FHA domain-containing protein [bacterium]|nr:FHA domain-containing protein [bacterium]
MLRKVEQALQAAIERPFSRLFPQKLQPAELKAPLREALESSIVSTADGALAANCYVVELNLADVREIEAVGPALEAELAGDLQEYAAEARVTLGPYLALTVGVAEDVPAGEMRVRAGFGERPPAYVAAEAGVPHVGRQVPLGESNVIGRANDCDIVIGEGAVSRRHCEIVWERVQYMLRDLGSANGTFVNAEQVQAAPLREGDLVEVGFVQLRFHDR